MYIGYGLINFWSVLLKGLYGFIIGPYVPKIRIYIQTFDAEKSK